MPIVGTFCLHSSMHFDLEWIFDLDGADAQVQMLIDFTYFHNVVMFGWIFAVNESGMVY